MNKPHRKAIPTLLLIFFVCLDSWGQPTAHELYNQGKYSEAIEILEKEGLNTAAQYYNAANSLFRLGKQGKALSYYEKANVLSPQNEDILYNLNLTKNLLTQTGGLPIELSIWKKTVIPLSQTYLLEFLLILFACSTGILAWMIIRYQRQVLRKPLAVCFLVLCLLTTTTVALLGTARNTEMAAIISDRAVVRSGPSESFRELMSLPAGSKIELKKASRDGWTQVQFASGSLGWLAQKDFLPL